MKIVVDENIPLAHNFFDSLGEVVALAPRSLSARHLRDAEMLIVRSVVPINEKLLADSTVKFVGTCTAGTDHLAVKYMDVQRITWCGAPGCNANAVVEYVFSVFAHCDLSWRDASVGIIGCGNVGGLLHRRLSALDVRCYCYDPLLDKIQNKDLTDLHAVLQCDIVCVHAPLTTGVEYPTLHMLGEAELLKLKPGATLINAGRGAVVDNHALLNVMQQRDDLRIVLDVWENEPNISMALLERVEMATPHIAGHSYDGKIRGTAMVYEAACRFLNKDPELSVEAFDKTPLQTHRLTDMATHQALNQAILQAYNVAEDNQKFRQAAQRKPVVAEAFDDFRKNYPQRREFSKHKFLVENVDRELVKQLKILGFQVGD